MIRFKLLVDESEQVGLPDALGDGTADGEPPAGRQAPITAQIATTQARRLLAGMDGLTVGRTGLDRKLSLGRRKRCQASPESSCAPKDTARRKRLRPIGGSGVSA